MNIDAVKNFLATKTLTIYLALMGLILAGLVVVSLSWRIQFDAVIFNYIALLMDRFNMMPYRDIFNYGLPSTYFLHWLIIKTVGYSDLAFRIFDLMFLLVFMVTTYLLMRNFSKRSGVAAALLVSLTYLSKGPEWSFERDFILMLPIAWALLTLVSTRITRLKTRWFLIGLLIGGAASIKPHAALAVFAFLAYDHTKEGENRLRVTGKRILWGTLGGMIIPLLGLLWIWYNGALSGFWDIFTNYVPLYNELNRDFQILHGMARLDDLFSAMNSLYPVGLLLAPALVGGYFFLNAAEAQKNLVKVISWLFVVFVIYLVIPNKLFLYHWFPLEYITCLLVSLCFAPQIKAKRFVYPLIIVVLTVNLLYAASSHLLFTPRKVFLDETEQVGDYLKNNIKPGQRVQGIGWIGYVIHGMYQGEVRLATPYPFITAFNHHLDHPYIQGLRIDMMKRLKTTPPRFIVYGLKEFLPGRDNILRNFPALALFIKENYSKVLQGQSYIIFEHKERL